MVFNLEIIGFMTIHQRSPWVVPTTDYQVFWWFNREKKDHAIWHLSMLSCQESMYLVAPLLIKMSIKNYKTHQLYSRTLPIQPLHSFFLLLSFGFVRTRLVRWCTYHYQEGICCSPTWGAKGTPYFSWCPRIRPWPFGKAIGKDIWVCLGTRGQTKSTKKV